MAVVTRTLSVTVPDIGDFKDVPIVEVLVKPGDVVNTDDPLITLETDKASMEVPAPSAGTVRGVHVKVGDRVSRGSPVIDLASSDGEEADAAPASIVDQQEPEPTPVHAPPTPERESTAAARAPVSPDADATATDQVHASPGVRRLARELGVDLRML